MKSEIHDQIQDQIQNEINDDDLNKFEAEGIALPPLSNYGSDHGHVEHEGALIWYASYGTGAPIILLHGGLGHSGNWGHQVPALLEAGYRVILIDSRGHGRSTRDTRPYTYELMASDVLAVMDTLQLKQASFIGWSDGACIALITAAQAPNRIAAAFFFGCNMDPSGLKQIDQRNPLLSRCLSRHLQDYAQLSATPDDFHYFAEAVGVMMKSQPNYTAHDLSQIKVPVLIVQAEHDEFIRDEHAEYLAHNIPDAKLLFLKDVSHFAPLQRPQQFNEALLAFLSEQQRPT
jgi:pimeloyl-ACP methyl ester carboxylesterase